MIFRGILLRSMVDGSFHHYDDYFHGHGHGLIYLCNNQVLRRSTVAAYKTGDIEFFFIIIIVPLSD